jgi:hypothetical protein
MKSIQLNNAIWKKGDHFVAQCLNINVFKFCQYKRRKPYLIYKMPLNCILKIMKFR